LQPCEYRLKCGHVCPYKVHNINVATTVFVSKHINSVIPMILAMSPSSALNLVESFASEATHVPNDVRRTVDDACIRFPMLHCLVIMSPTQFRGESDFNCLIDQFSESPH